MRLNKKQITACLFATILFITGCSSSTSSSSGTGQIPTGLYAGNLNGQASVADGSAAPTVTKIQLSIVTPITSTATGTTLGAPTGTMAVTGGTVPRCFSGGTITGTVNGDQMTLTINDGTNDLTMTGRFTSSQYSGTFSVPNSSCGTVSGGFDLKRV